MRYQSPDSDYEHFVDLGEFESTDWHQVVDLYAIVRPIEYTQGSYRQYISLGARFSDEPGDYHSVPVFLHVKKGVVDLSPFEVPSLTGDNAIDGVRESVERLKDIGILGK